MTLTPERIHEYRLGPSGHGPRENGYTFCPYCGGTLKEGGPR